MPKKHYEMTFCTALKKWLDHEFPYNCFIEAKISVDDKPFNLRSGFKEHQLPCLISARQGVFSYKISDMDRMQKPFDIIHTHKIKTYVAIMWIRKGNKTFYLINPIAIQGMIDDSKKSITEEDAVLLSDFMGILK